MASSVSAPIVSFDDVHLTLDSQAGPVNILRGMTFQVGKGEKVGIVGPSGSGKSTMMMVLAGLERQSSGRVLVAGQPLGELDEDGLARFRRDHVGIVFQAFHLVPTMTALENVAIPLEFAGDADAFASARAGLEAVGLGHRIDHYPAQLSGGEQQRVALARAFVTRPALLLADEPTGNLDVETGHRIVELLFDLADRFGTTLMLITHDAGLAARCDRRLKVASGRITEEETV